MAVLITERNARSISENKNAQGIVDVTASRVFDVTGVADAAAARAALATRDPDPIDYDLAHPQNERACINSIQQADNTTAGMFTFSVNYSSVNSNIDVVMLEPPVISIKPYRYVIMSDKDANGVAFCSTAGFPFEGGTPVERRGVKWSYSRWEQTYPWETDFAYGGKTNSNTLTLPGIPADIPPKLAKFEGVEQGERSAISPVIRVTYTFDIRETGHTNDVIDQSAVGWCFKDGDSIKTAGLFVAGDHPLDALGPVRLDGTGKPINAADVKVAPAYSKAFDADTPDVDSPSRDVVSDPVSSGGKTTYDPNTNPGGVVVLEFATCVSVPMSLTL